MFSLNCAINKQTTALCTKKQKMHFIAGSNKRFCLINQRSITVGKNLSQVAPLISQDQRTRESHNSIFDKNHATLLLKSEICSRYFNQLDGHTAQNFTVLMRE